MYDIFGKYGAIRQIRVGNTPETRGTAFVVYEDIFDAKNACDHLSGKEPFFCEIIKFGLSEKHIKSCAIFLMLWTFTKCVSQKV